MNDPRDPLLARLRDYDARYPLEARTASRIREFVLSSRECFRREHLAGHVTGSAWIVNATGELALLTHHRKLNRWMQLGGHSDGDPRTEEVALREAHEESGLNDIRLVTPEIFDVDVHEIPARGAEPAHLHYDLRFLLRAAPGAERAIVVSEESHDLKWVSAEEMLALTQEPSMLRMREKWLAWRRV